VIRRGRYGTGTYKERGPGWRSDPGGRLRCGFGDLPQVLDLGSRAVPRGSTQGTIVGAQDRVWVSCVLTRRRGGSWACQNPRREGGIGVRGCPASRGTRGRSGRPTFLLLGAPRGGRWRQRRANPTLPRARATSLWYGYMPKKCPGGRTRAAGGLRRQCGGEEGVGVVAWWVVVVRE